MMPGTRVNAVFINLSPFLLLVIVLNASLSVKHFELPPRMQFCAKMSMKTTLSLSRASPPTLAQAASFCARKLPKQAKTKCNFPWVQKTQTCANCIKTAFALTLPHSDRARGEKRRAKHGRNRE